MYFTFEGQVFLQSEGLLVGCSISGILAILFMDKLQNIALSSHRFIEPYKRYVDDIYLQTTSENTADEFHQTMDDLHPPSTVSYAPTAILKTWYSKPNDSANADINHDNNTPIEIGCTSKSHLFLTD